jgi:hypothetical protein
VLADKAVLGRLVDAGWFPFVEILPSDFRALADAAEAGFDLGEAETNLLGKFDGNRLDEMFARWIAKPHFAAKKDILSSAVQAFKAKDPVACITIVLTEIEGVLDDAYRTVRCKCQAQDTAEICSLICRTEGGGAGHSAVSRVFR